MGQIFSVGEKGMKCRQNGNRRNGNRQNGKQAKWDDPIKAIQILLLATRVVMSMFTPMP